MTSGLERYLALADSAGQLPARECERLLGEIEQSYTTSEERHNHSGHPRAASAAAGDAITFF